MRQLLPLVLAGVALAGCNGLSGPQPGPKPPAQPMDEVMRETFEGPSAATWRAVDPTMTPPLLPLSEDPKGLKWAQWKIKHWYATDAGAWKIAKEGNNTFLSLHRQSRYKPADPSPINYVLVPEIMATSYQLDLKVRSTSPKATRRDLILVFGYENPRQYYYAHLCDTIGKTAHGIFVVDGTQRRPITYQRNAGITWGDGWHHVRLIRRWANGEVLVFFDDMTAPVINAQDKRFSLGRIGFGSFNDLGDFDEIVLKAVATAQGDTFEIEDVKKTVEGVDRSSKPAAIGGSQD